MRVTPDRDDARVAQKVAARYVSKQATIMPTGEIKMLYALGSQFNVSLHGRMGSFDENLNEFTNSLQGGINSDNALAIRREAMRLQSQIDDLSDTLKRIRETAQRIVGHSQVEIYAVSKTAKTYFLREIPKEPTKPHQQPIVFRGSADQINKYIKAQGYVRDPETLEYVDQKSGKRYEIS